MNIVALVGSLRKDSYNRKLAEWMRERYKDKFQLDIADIGALPHYNQDDELNPPEVVAAFKRQVANADGVLIVTPEYNWSVPGVLKNALDWLSRVDKVLVNKPVMIAGVSTG
ncbi:NADPH azoreductase [Geobacillus sp. BCO2]|nr:NADPH azoreductase [Geobacillus sp. BCO2]